VLARNNVAMRCAGTPMPLPRRASTRTNITFEHDAQVRGDVLVGFKMLGQIEVWQFFNIDFFDHR
jgi:hypothetical protein